jgi:hypothetical protein
MGRAASGRLEGEAGVLDELRFHRGSAYDIDAAGEVYAARPCSAARAGRAREGTP